MIDEALMTPEGRAALERELAELTEVKRPALAARIKSARELGDLKENAEYHAAKEEQAFLETRIKQVEHQLRNATVVEGSGDGAATVGSSVVLRDLADGSEETWTITGVDEADPLEARISYESPIGSALMGRHEGDEVEVQAPAGTRRYQVVSVGRA